MAECFPQVESAEVDECAGLVSAKFTKKDGGFVRISMSKKLAGQLSEQLKNPPPWQGDVGED